MDNDDDNDVNNDDDNDVNNDDDNDMYNYKLPHYGGTSF